MFVIEGTADMGYNNSSCYLVKNLHIEETKPYQSGSPRSRWSPRPGLLRIYRTLHRSTDESSTDSRPDEAEGPDLSGIYRGGATCVALGDIRVILLRCR